ncbi:MAG: hypothetical protein H7836_17420, partial [Magnetococcus sp. YQC-3]
VQRKIKDFTPYAERLMNKPIVVAVLKMGFEYADVRDAIAVDLKGKRKALTDMSDLVEATLLIAKNKILKKEEMTEKDIHFQRAGSSQQKSSENEISPLHTTEEIDSRIACKICLQKKLSIVLLPCGHFASCEVCTVSLEKCPICRGDCKGYVRVYMS